MSDAKKFSGRRRRMKTSPLVKFGDRCARLLITVGGIGTIVAVLLICVFLVQVVVPLFYSPKIKAEKPIVAAEQKWLDFAPRDVQLIEKGDTGWTTAPDGSIHYFRTNDGALITTLSPEKTEITKDSLVKTYADGRTLIADQSGTIRLAQITATVKTVSDASDLSNESVEKLKKTSSIIEKDSFWKKDSSGAISGTTLELQPVSKIDVPKFEDTTEAATVALVDMATELNAKSTKQIGHVTSAGQAAIAKITSKTNPITRKVTESTTSSPTIEIQSTKGTLPDYFIISGMGEYAYFVWKDGTTVWLETRDVKNPRLLGVVDLLPETDAKLTELKLLVGGTTLLAGDSLGRVRAWFPSVNKPTDASHIAPEVDHSFLNPQKDESLKQSFDQVQSLADDASLQRPHLVLGHDLRLFHSSVRSIRTTGRDRTILANDDAGTLKIVFVTNESTIATLQSPKDDPVRFAIFSPRQSRLLTVGEKSWRAFDYHSEHSDISLASMFGSIWYEGQPAPQYVWQTSGGESSEPQYSLMPLIYGTLKATFYSMLFGAPIALLAAIYTSEFMHPSVKAMIKPVIELMASLPSVVLGFLAYQIFAPTVKEILPEVITGLFTIPISILFGSFLWQLLPQQLTLRAGSWRLLAIAGSIVPGILFAYWSGTTIEHVLFGSDITRWLAENPHGIESRSSPAGGWFVLMLPLSAILVGWWGATFFESILRSASRNWTRRMSAVAHGCKFLAMILAIGLLSALFASMLTMIGVDPRGSEKAMSYETQNALVVGITMGFAIIPLIYTIADDALSTVPNHLRSASLGAGATPWQTANRIVVPMAVSGLFSALMIGLGRAVGETMIVRMAAGNTPIMDFNIFNGFQTLSAGIATELLEAPVNSTHYRVLFVAALALFLLTFVINTVAEVVRQRFRKRAYEL
jgi:phosphate transport system permease protein